MKFIKPLVLLSFIFVLVSAKAQQTAVASASDSKYLTQYQGLELATVGNHVLDLKANALLVDAPGQRMIRVGKTLTFTGIILVAGGVILMSTADALYYRASTSSYGGSQEEGDIKGALGVALTTGGVGMIIPGAIVWSKGKKKYAAYQATGASLSLGINNNGAGLRFNF